MSSSSISEYEISFLGKSITFFNPIKETGEHYLYDKFVSKVTLNRETVLPVKRSTVKKTLYDISEKQLTRDEAEQKAYNTMYAKIASSLHDCEVISLSYSNQEKDDCFVLNCKAECIRDVAVRADN